ncbi:hypothetical protein HNY73_018352 [Argiope bruennichi]|uniref:Uncharacterized protein n=1 Tax=Argiope bruennichi TaxID=94029 RepID=A0A8T0EGP1_ARGBR|nr:hypothetical protein HNY73_018352 [Argiope bruennichi]
MGELVLTAISIQTGHPKQTNNLDDGQIYLHTDPRQNGTTCWRSKVQKSQCFAFPTQKVELSKVGCLMEETVNKHLIHHPMELFISSPSPTPHSVVIRCGGDDG